MVRNKTSTALMFVGFGIWISAILLMSFSQTAYFVLTAAAIAVFLSAIVVGLFYKQLLPPTSEA